MSDPRAAARAAAAAFEAASPPEVGYVSDGAVLVAGPALRALPVAVALGAVRGLRVVAVVEGLPADAQVPRRVTAVPGRIARLNGFLGRFAAEAASPSGPLDLAPLSPNRSGRFDVVVDLGEQPLSTLEVTPPGYFRPARTTGDTTSLAAAITALSGETTKTQFVRHVESLCTHSAQSLTGCTSCLNVCPAGAISSDGSRIAVESGLCRGCAACTLACPTGAMAFTAPRARDLRTRLGLMLEAFSSAGGAPPWVLFHGPADAARAAVARAAQTDAKLLPIEVSTPASAGADTWLAALGMGAAKVRVLDDPMLPVTVRRVLAQALEDTRGVLSALGVDAHRLALVRADALDADALPRECGSAGAGERFAVQAFADSGPGKREALERAIEMLAPAGAPAARRALPAGSAFGAVNVDEATCTYCLACVRICPTHALAGDSARGALQFTESACVQCGLCAVGCPEEAIGLEPSFEPDLEARSRARVVHRAELVACTRCAEPFLPRALLDASLARIGGNVAANAQVAAMLEVCPRCRSQAAMGEPFIKGRTP